MPIKTTTEGRVLTITIDGYNHLNPITQDMYEALSEQLTAYDRDPELRVAILRGDGDQHFSVGGNLKVYHGASEVLPPLARVQAFWYPWAWTNTPANSVSRVTIWGRRTIKPVVAAVPGYCLGAAFMILGLHTSIRIAGENAKFGLAEIQRGLGGSASVRSLLPRQIPHAAMMWLALTGGSIDAQAALRMGLVTEVVPVERVFERAQEVASAIAEAEPVGILAAKEAYYQVYGQPQERLAAFTAALDILNRLDPVVLETSLAGASPDSDVPASPR
jgi:enoyl-CoA hydratase/carnithine racemase